MEVITSHAHLSQNPSQHSIPSSHYQLNLAHEVSPICYLNTQVTSALCCSTNLESALRSQYYLFPQAEFLANPHKLDCSEAPPCLTLIHGEAELVSLG